MRRKKWAAIGISAVLAMAVLAGCNGSGVDMGTMTNEEIKKFEENAGGLKLPLDKNGTTLSIICDTSQDSNDSVVINELRRRTGINLQLIQIPRATIKEKARVLIASKTDMPDIFNGAMTAEEVNDIGMQGAFEPINEHIDELPNFKSIFIDNAQELKTEKVMKSFPAPDGNIYIFPRYDTERYVNHGMLYRKDIFDKHNIPMWNSTEEYYQTLKKLKTIYPSSIPLVSKTGVTIFNQLGQSWGLGSGSPGIYFEEETRTWKYASTDPKYKDMLDFIKKLYNEKLLDPEFLTCTQAAWTTKMTQAESAFTTFDWIGRLDMFREQAQATVPDYDLRYGYPIGPTGKVVTLPQINGGPAVKKSKNSELALKLLDYLISPAGAELMTCGIEGVTFNWNADKTHADYIGFEEGKVIGINDLEEKYGMFVSGLYRRFDHRSVYFNYTEREQEAQDMMLNKDGGGFIPEPPELVYTSEEKDIITQNDAKLRKAAEEFATKYILTNDQTGDAAWNNWLKQAAQLGVKSIEDANNSAQARYDAK